jgi:Ca-activated chloride channel family protein
MPRQGSNTTLALQQAVALLKQSGLNQGDILLVSDGVDLGHVEDEIASLDSFRLSVLAVGTSEGAPIKLERGNFLKTSDGEIVIAKLNISELQQVASSGGGLFQLLSNDSSDSNNLIAFIDRHLETGDQKNSDLLLDQWQEQGPWLLLLVLPLAALTFRKGIICITFMLLMPLPKNSYALEWQDLWQTGDQRGQQLYAQEKYEQAAEQFNDPQWQAAAQYKAGQYEQVIETLKEAETSDDFYNTGNTLARSGQLQQAIESYDEALDIDPKNTDAQYNKELVEKAIKEQEQNQQQSENESDQNQSDSKPSDSNQSDSEPSDSSQKDSNQASEDEQSESSDQQPEDDSETDKQHQQQQAESAEQTEQEDTDAQSTRQSVANVADESQQANEQWLNRIPDNPAGLLRRKFKYQYGQRKHQNNSEQDW